jgi:aerobic-type carbon monoxide dehydrogenase small subunit (CoxS/CutS family)
MPTNLTVNGRTANVDAAPDTPLLWVLRDILKLHGTKYGCGIGQCGACTVHLNGEPTRRPTLCYAFRTNAQAFVTYSFRGFGGCLLLPSPATN